MMTLLRCWQSLLVTILLLAAAPLIAGPAHAEVAAEDGVLDAEFLALDPVVLVEGSELTLRVRVTNRTDAVVEGGTIRLLAQEWTPNTRTSLTRWLDEDRYDATLLLHSDELPVLEPGAGHEATLTVDAAAFRFNTWGPRGIEVFASAPANDDGVRPPSDRERAWVIWWNEPAITPVGIGFLSPVVPTVTELTDPGSSSIRVRALLDQATIPGVTTVVDPALLEGALVTAAADRAWTLPWGNADSAALLAAGRADLLTDLRERSATALPGAAGTIDWPAEPDLATLSGTTGDVVVVDDVVAPPTEARSYTRHAVGTLADRTAVVLDTPLGDALTATATVDGTTFVLTDVQRRQYLAAATAVLVRERPGEARAVFAALPSLGGAEHADLLQTVAEFPWVTPTTLGDALATEKRTALDTALLAPEPELTSAVTAAELRRADSARETLTLFGQVVTDPATTVEPLLADLAIVPSVAWRSAPGARALLLDGVAATADAYASGLAIRGASSINMVSESANFPVTIISSLPEDATVQVHLMPSERGLEQAEPVAVTVPAGGEVTAEVPVSGVGWGDITVEVHLAAPSGTQLGDAVEIPVRVRANWESLGMTALVLVGMLAFVVGIVRTVLRNRRTGRAEEVEAAARRLAQEDRMQEVGREGRR
ncbi:MAG: DUF6049 family protein [Actinomycetota bacterium]